MNPLPDPHTFTILIYIDRSLHRPVISLSAMKNGDITIIDRMLICLSNKIRGLFQSVTNAFGEFFNGWNGIFKGNSSIRNVWSINSKKSRDKKVTDIFSSWEVNARGCVSSAVETARS